MLEDISETWKTRILPWLSYFKPLRDMLSTAKDVYGDLLGVDFDDSVLLSFQLKGLLGTLRFVQAGIVGLSHGVIADDTITDVPVFVKAVKKMLEEAKIQTKNAVIALPGSKVAIKKIKLEAKLSEEAAEARAWQEAQKTFPELVKSLLLDFVQIETLSSDNIKNWTLVLIVARKEDVLPRVDILKQAGLTTKIADVDYFSLERAYTLFASQLPEKHEEKYLALIDFNPHSILFVVMHQKSMRYYSRQSYAGDALVPIVRRIMGVEVRATQTEKTAASPVETSAQANPSAPLKMETEKTLPFPSPLAVETQTVAQSQVGLLTEDQKSHIVMTIRRLFQSFYTENPGHIIECVAMTGRCALIPEVTQYVEKMLDISLTIPNPLLALKNLESKNRESIVKLGPAFTLCCGIAMRGMPLWK
ncbi:MAG: hypothetical protein COY58_03460 [Gammaproteobacteria bacterium CG_4_10_14_0_8_um_filter_38_16]|nr:MAG: hypothetical protein COY58_03460 [Gammaproteobacteria bacterium CG_4_10_14_0_8_um_filter_38_16]PJA03640.1 MAG: hypothetical protein COX72_03845 [Gammaproteobacteria bacterium CG_4_10_14_0_2_um_filter_38_22]PJB11306.1 MAG: hypothetical protein CO120_00650 [Gammaproteobacteria bacterium CG_4_9_14_3_um_filter_38_9]